jgi:outer membrane protein assembly factor BamD
VCLIAAAVGSACAPGFQVKQFHTNSDLYEASAREYGKKKWDNAILGFERLTLDLSARDTLLARSHWYLAMSHEQRGEHLLAATSFLRLAELFPDDSLADDALLAGADAYAKLWRSPGLDPQYGTLAQMQYRLLESIYPDSPLRVKAQQGAQRVDEWLATKEYETAVHYVKRRAFDSALISFKFVVKEYPNTTKVREALMRMVEVYRRPELKYVPEAKETCATLRIAYPVDSDVAKLCGPSEVTADSAATPGATAPAKPKPLR